MPSLRDLGRTRRSSCRPAPGRGCAAAGFGDVREIAVGDDGRRRRRRGPGRAGRPLRVTGRRSGRRRRRSGSWSAAARSVYFAGDTDLFDGMGELGEPIDIACSRSGAGARRSVAASTSTRCGRPQALRLIRPRAAVPIHWGTYWPHALGRVFPERLVEPPAAFAEYAAELAPDVRTAADGGRRRGGVGAVTDDVTRPFDAGRPAAPPPAARRPGAPAPRGRGAVPDLRRGLRRLSRGLIAYGIVGLVVAVARPRRCCSTSTRGSTPPATGSRRPSAQLATTLDRTADGAPRRVDDRRDLHRHARPDRRTAVVGGGDTIVSVRTNLETLESVLRPVSILGPRRSAGAADAVGGIASSIEGLDSRLDRDRRRPGRQPRRAGGERDVARRARRQHRLRWPSGSGSGVVEDSLADVHVVDRARCCSC